MPKLEDILDVVDQFEETIDQLWLSRELGTSKQETAQEKKVKLLRKKLKDTVREAFDDLQENRKLRVAMLSAYEISSDSEVDAILLDALGEDYEA